MLIDQNIIHDNATTLHESGYGHGIWCISSSCTISRNVVYNHNTGFNSNGIMLFTSTTPTCDDNIVDSNTVRNNSGYGILIGVGADNLCYNNVVYSNTNGGIIISSNASGTGLYNNTLWNNDGSGIEISNSTSSIIRNNILYQNDIDTLNVTAGGPTYTEDHNLFGVNPVFVALGSDFHIQSSSPAIDNGFDTRAIFDHDRDGNGRTDETVDIGAYEFQDGVIRAPFYQNTVTLFVPTVRYPISLPTITTGAVVRTPTVSGVTGQSVTTPTIASGAVVRIPAVKYVISLPTITSGATVYQPAMGQQVRPPTISSGVTVSTPTVAAVYTLQPPTIASGSSVSIPTVFVDVPDTALLFPPPIAAGSQVFIPVVTFGAVALLPPTIASGATVYEPSTTYVVEGPTIASGSLPFAPVLASSPSGQGILGATVASGSSVFEPSLATTITISLPTISAGSVVYIPGLEHLVPPFITSTAALYIPTVAGGVSTPFITSEAEIFTPSIAGGAGGGLDVVNFITAYMWKRIA
jgi:hypothetical protein